MDYTQVIGGGGGEGLHGGVEAAFDPEFGPELAFMGAHGRHLVTHEGEKGDTEDGNRRKHEHGGNQGEGSPRSGGARWVLRAVGFHRSSR